MGTIFYARRTEKIRKVEAKIGAYNTEQCHSQYDCKILLQSGDSSCLGSFSLATTTLVGGVRQSTWYLHVDKRTDGPGGVGKGAVTGAAERRGNLVARTASSSAHSITPALSACRCVWKVDGGDYECDYGAHGSIFRQVRIASPTEAPALRTASPPLSTHLIAKD